jgi:predicted secreted protein
VVVFAATATLEVTKDLLTVNLQATREGTEAAAVQTQLKQVLDAALTEAKKTAQPGALDVRTGQFSISPRYGRDGRVNGWQGMAELVLEGRDNARVAQAAGRVQGMTLTSTGYSLSRELQAKHELELTGQAIQKFRARATDIAKQFGFSSYALREVNVSAQEPGFPQPMYRGSAMLAKAASPEMDAAVPTEPGKGLLSATVQGSVQLIR